MNDPSISPKAKKKAKEKPRLECRCGNVDQKQFGFFDIPAAVRTIEGFADDGVLLVSSHYDIEYYGGETEYLSCHKCGDTKESPFEVDFVD